MGLSVTNLSHSYDGKLFIFRDLSFSVEKGKALAVTGHNGSGKTTLLRILNGLLTPLTGKIEIDGVNSKESVVEFNRKIGWVPSQETGFFSRLTGLDNILFFTSFYGISEKEVISFVNSWRDIDPVKRALETPYILCSSGMKRSLLLLRALVHRPDCLFMDEPFFNFDEKVFGRIVEKLKEMSSEMKIVFSTHSREQALIFNAEIIDLGGQRD